MAIPNAFGVPTIFYDLTPQIDVTIFRISSNLRLKGFVRLILTEKLTGPSVWTGSEITGEASWIHELTGGEIASLDNALSSLKISGKCFPKFVKEDFRIPAWTERLRFLSAELDVGRGFFVMSGFPVERCSDADIKNFLWDWRTFVRRYVKIQRAIPRHVMTVGDPNNREIQSTRRTHISPMTLIHRTSSACYAFVKQNQRCQQPCQRSVCR